MRIIISSLRRGTKVFFVWRFGVFLVYLMFILEFSGHMPNCAWNCGQKFGISVCQLRHPIKGPSFNELTVRSLIESMDGTPAVA